ncbi:DUF4129 domain-containing protein [Candidatus Bipolaricaulota bacterium]|nr:DUF4129 domain-containing protein [Candidatus Bipolaricaulota bacterium]
MSVQSRAGNAFLVLAILALFGLLVLLIGSLDELSFQPGKLLPHAESGSEDEVDVLSTAVTLSPRERLYASILVILTLISVICVFVFKKVRILVLQYLFTLMTLVLPVLLGIMFFSRFFSGWFQRHASDELVVPGPVIPDSLLANPPTWSLALAAGAVSLLILGLGTYFAIRWLAFRTYVEKRKTELATLQEEQQAVAEKAAQAASRIRRGKPLQGEVIRCYQEMTQSLSKHRNVKPTYLTAREFAVSLTQLGIQTEHVNELTALFELVRYGDRDDQSLADRALDCLDRFRSTYGMKEDQ